jgi:hypothetical protein
MVLSVEAARLCPDCDIITEAQTCPQCGRDWTFPLAAWMGLLEHPELVPDVVDRPLRRRGEVVLG